MNYNRMGNFVRLSVLKDEDGKEPPEDLNPPVGRELKKVVGSKPFPPKKEEEAPPEGPASRR